MTAPRQKPSVVDMQRLLNRLRARYDSNKKFRDFDLATWSRDHWPGKVDTGYLRPWLSNSNITDEDFQAMAEYNARDGLWSIARFCRLMCFTSKTQRKLIR